MGGLARPARARRARLTGALWIMRLEAAPVGGAGPVVWTPEPGTTARCPPLPQDVAHAARRRDPERRAATLRRRLLLRALAARVLDCASGAVEIEQAAAGGPIIVAPASLFASAAARGDRMLLAVSPHPLGVDLERIEPAAHRPLDLLHPQFAAELAGADAKAFTRAWSGAEAYLKMLGLPLDQLAEIRVAGDRIWRPGSNSPPARLEQRVAAGCVHTLAVPR